MTTLHNCKKLSRQLLVQQGLLVKAFLKIAVLEIGSFNDFRKKLLIMEIEIRNLMRISICTYISEYLKSISKKILQQYSLKNPECTFPY